MPEGKEQQQDGTGVHGMPYPAIRSGGDPLLLLGDFDHCAGVTVFLEGEEDDNKAQYHEPVGNPTQDRRYHRPMEAEIQTGDNEQANEEQAGKGLDNQLHLLGLGGGTGMGAAGQ